MPADWEGNCENVFVKVLVLENLLEVWHPEKRVLSFIYISSQVVATVGN